ncbi:hypothetical protein CAOG_08801 [Capsaspora owczarzaki ATCC 30864]|uniref:Uncharacterized protein n=1 Tax=Capsaspora owczarzaki (strain ATCC 30864) TaxID=595528 RepID=A0A0D2X399_CAPO3|nr:hypothetical protein CAOG_08801 [Capsaspora owczarzaki ATCC 30864]KJE93939.1 hypothetical protein CAOG_008801 [Capsaspora owczarzaki ATCC 30864]|eukprot:XP_011270441.1 hypothetical protein CAOG_08801 [Capsaspora owczarzaki ATCC 30864]
MRVSIVHVPSPNLQTYRGSALCPMGQCPIRDTVSTPWLSTVDWAVSTPLNSFAATFTPRQQLSRSTPSLSSVTPFDHHRFVGVDVRDLVVSVPAVVINGKVGG